MVDDRLTGVLNLKKPSGVSSRAVVDRVVKAAGPAKVGHAGTLDPLASGVLVVCVGAATRLIEWVQRMPKTYRTTIRLDAVSDTLDADGQVVPLPDPVRPTSSQVEAAVGSQVGEIDQRPPEYSALKVKGRRAYDLARSGQAVELAPRSVRIDRIAIVEYAWPRVELEIDCGGGTYIRSIARDLGEQLGCGGLVEVLVRTRIGEFTLDSALDPEAITPSSLPMQLRPALEAVAELPRLVVDEGQVAEIGRGKTLDYADVTPASDPRSQIALIAPDGRLVAIAEVDPLQRLIQPRKVMI